MSLPSRKEGERRGYERLQLPFSPFILILSPPGMERGRLDLSGTFMSAIKSQNGGGAAGRELGRMRRSGEEEGLPVPRARLYGVSGGRGEGSVWEYGSKRRRGKEGRIDQVWKPLPLAHRRRTRKHDTYVHRHESVGGTPRH